MNHFKWGKNLLKKAPNVGSTCRFINVQSTRKRSYAASYASFWTLDKRFVLISLALWFPSSGSTWWSASSPPSYSLCASKCPNTWVYSSVRWHTSLPVFFLPNFYSPHPRAQVWMRLGECISFVQLISWDNQMNSGNAKMHTLRNLICCCDAIMLCIKFCLKHNTVAENHAWSVFHSGCSVL